MNPKSILAIMFILAPTVYGCVNFQAQYQANSNPGAYPLSAQLWDNLGRGDTPTCSMNGYTSSDGLYHLTCIESDYTATFDGSQFDGIVNYNNPGGSYQFSVPPAGAGTAGYAVCEYGCSQCFVPTF